jgi:transcriptional regulator with XRE-family HTH domain
VFDIKSDEAARLLRTARAHAGLTQRALAERAGVAQPMIAAIENGRRDPRYGTLALLLRACDRDLDLVPLEGLGIERSQFREAPRLTPSERLRRAAHGARTLRALRAARRVR